MLINCVSLLSYDQLRTAVVHSRSLLDYNNLNDKKNNLCQSYKKYFL